MHHVGIIEQMEMEHIVVSWEPLILTSINQLIERIEINDNLILVFFISFC